MRWVEPIAGALPLALVLADVFLTILYARAGTGIISDRLARLVWLALRRAAPDRSRSYLLSFCGPFIVFALLLTWSILLALGAALIVHPQLGATITNTNQSTPTDFVTALYIAGSSLSIVGGSNFAPQSSGTKLLFLLNSVTKIKQRKKSPASRSQVISAAELANATAEADERLDELIWFPYGPVSQAHQRLWTFRTSLRKVLTQSARTGQSQSNDQNSSGNVWQSPVPVPARSQSRHTRPPEIPTPRSQLRPIRTAATVDQMSCAPAS